MPDLATRCLMRRPPKEVIVDAIAEMVGRPDYPCLGARSVFRRDRATVRVYDELDAPATAPLLLQDLLEFASAVDLDEGFASFIAIFRGPRIIDERHFERLLWSQLRRLHAADEEPWSDEVSPDPEDEHFAFSVAGNRLLRRGPAPMASRDARRAASPPWSSTSTSSSWRCGRRDTIPRMRDRIRDRDEQLQGTINPMVADHGEISRGPAVLRPGGRGRLAGSLRRAGAGA